MSCIMSVSTTGLPNILDLEHRTFLVQFDLNQSEEALKANRPAIRNSLVMLLSRQVYDQLMTPEGKEKLRADALVEVRAIVTKVAGPKPAKQIQDVFFSSLVMQ